MPWNFLPVGNVEEKGVKAKKNLGLEIIVHRVTCIFQNSWNEVGMTQRGLICIFVMIIGALGTWAHAGTVTKTSFFKALVVAAVERTTHSVLYDVRYQRIPYPMGDVSKAVGVCTDVIIRSYRAVGIDLQKLVHEDMASHFSDYPNHWGLRRPDQNIDHRRVPNLKNFFKRYGGTLPISRNPEQYHAGDIVTWVLPGNLPHIGLVSDTFVGGTKRLMIVHNIGRGPHLEDRLLDFPITGHFRFIPHRESGN